MIRLPHDPACADPTSEAFEDGYLDGHNMRFSDDHTWDSYVEGLLKGEAEHDLDRAAFQNRKVTPEQIAAKMHDLSRRRMIKDYMHRGHLTREAATEMYDRAMNAPAALHLPSLEQLDELEFVQHRATEVAIEKALARGETDLTTIITQAIADWQYYHDHAFDPL